MLTFLQRFQGAVRLCIAVTPRRVVLVIGASAAIALLVLAAYECAERRAAAKRTRAAAPRLSLDRWRHDFGAVCPGEKVEAEFRVANIGASDLRLKSVDKSCGCAAPVLGTDLLAPGGTTSLKVALSVAPYPGMLSHWVKLHTNDPNGGILQLDLVGVIRWPVDVAPSNVYFGLLLPGQAATCDVELFSADGPTVDVRSATASKEWLTVESLAGSGARRARFRLTALAPEKTGGFEEQVEFRTSSDKRPVVKVEVRGEVVAARKASPSRLLLGHKAAGSEVKAALIIQSAVKEATNVVQDVAMNDAAWRISHWEAKRINEKTVKLTLSIRIPENDGYQRGTIVVLGGRNATPLEVPVGCLVE